MLTDFLPTAEAKPGSQTLPVAFVSCGAALGDALHDSIDAAVWRRRLPDPVQHWVDDLRPESLPEGRFVLRPDQVAVCMAQMFCARGLARSPALDWLCHDADALAHALSQRLGWHTLRLRLEAVFDNACSKMHVDHVTARLVCTHRGPGTELGTQSTDQQVFTAVPTGAPILLKGTRWPAARAPQLRHRSPAIAGTGISRLVFALEGVSDDDIHPDYDRLFHDHSTMR